MGIHVSVAQLDRASLSEGEGLGFESQRAQFFRETIENERDIACGVTLCGIWLVASRATNGSKSFRQTLELNVFTAVSISSPKLPMGAR